jgi:phospholipid-binding lipoprotein MlaA
MYRPVCAIALYIGLAATSICAQTTELAAPTSSVNDPYINTNRGLYDFNIGFDKLTLRPTARFYRAVMPEKAKTGVTNFVHHLREPLSFINLLLQGKPGKAAKTLGRFVVNTTAGFVGFRDVATDAGLPRYSEDFGQTLAVWGVPSGPYLMLPFLGPSNPRDFVGFWVDFFGSPSSLAISREISPYASYGATATYFLDVRQRALSTVDKVLDTSTDPYVALRSAYIQRRNFNIADGVEDKNEATPDPFEDDSVAPQATTPPTSAPDQPGESLKSDAPQF